MLWITCQAPEETALWRDSRISSPAQEEPSTKHALGHALEHEHALTASTSVTLSGVGQFGHEPK